MKRIEKTFKSLERSALVTFITAGDPDYETSLEVLNSLPGAGADIIELGMPFTDPMADGPVIQNASIRALESGANMKKTLEMVKVFRAENDETPIVLMGYMNPVFAYGVEAFCDDAAEAGVDGLIIVDLPPEEADEIIPYIQKSGLDLIRLLTPTTDDSRLERVLEGASGFLYYVSITGVTGTARADKTAVAAHIQKIKQHTNLPIAIGFGIKTPEDVSNMSILADGVVVGSAIVENMAKQASEVPPQVRKLAAATAVR